MGSRSQAGATVELAPFLLQPAGFDPARLPALVAGRDAGTREAAALIARRADATLGPLSLIYYRGVICRYRYGDTDFTPIHSRDIGAAMGTKEGVRPLLDAMIACGLIESDGWYAKGFKSLGYRIGPSLLGLRWEAFRPQGRRLAKRAEAFRQVANAPANFTLPVHHHLHQWVRRATLAGDIEAAIAAIPERQPGGRRRKKGWKPSRPGPPKSVIARHQVALFDAGYRHAAVCDYGRFHSPVTNMFGLIRALLHVDGEPLVEIDLANSQPYFLAMRQLASHTETGWTSENLCDHEGREEGQAEAPHHMFPVCGPEKSEAWEFARVTAAGKYYESFASEGVDRKQAKRLSLGFLFGSEDDMTRSKLAPAFRAKYPTVFDSLLAMKREPQPDTRPEESYCGVARALQRMESRVIIEGVCERLRADYPRVPILTVHDSLMTTRAHVGLVRDLMTEAFRSFPLQPTIREK